ncbi:MAG: sodium-dependent transporter [Woeseiaceae bacterium]|nr:sodium-dependent transporter [Woeseiaceae bacterium]
MDRDKHTWSSGLTFVLAAVGAAVGLGNIWKFPYVAGVSGGGAFVIIYLLCVVFVALPVLMSELVLGRLGAQSPPLAMAAVAERAGSSRRWSLVGYMGVAVGYLIATYYSVIAGWTLAYILKAANGFGGAEPADVANQFEALQADPGLMTLYHTIFIVVALMIVGAGLKNGIERAVKILMPALFVMLIVMIGYATVAGDMPATIEFLFSADFDKITGEVVLLAIGQSFFSISVAMGLIMVYGSYVPKDVSLTKSAVIIVTADTAVALLAGLMIFPIVFANGFDPASGPGLIFRTLPTAFAAMPGGSLFGALFFLLLAFAAITSIIAIIEPIVAYAHDRWGMARRNGVIVFGFLAWLIGIGTVLSFNLWQDWAPLGMLPPLEGKTVFDLIDYVTAYLLMPIGGILMTLFVGWKLAPKLLSEELSLEHPVLFRVWLFLVRFLAPLAILGVLIINLGPGEAG